MTGEMIAFFFLALTAIAGGVLLINLTNVVHMVVALIFTFIAIAGIYVTLSAEFVAVVQVLIYSGAITIIMLFGIMLTRHQEKEKQLPRLKVILTGLAIGLFFLIMYGKIKDLDFGQQNAELHIDNTKKIGIELYSHFVIPFELTSVLLLVALIGSIILAKRDDDEKEAKK
ncbi:NADH-quinone oxidoreductase subunit J [Fictibacillus sp. b24]|uniref:NADH-quinone oxidoreductase subunit J n=1 Tax=Fictibacillus sp. b24 TaxID=3055863 RepID=UPI0025A21A8A|nr:NADH-quinone oxidoreductase subunit J [Fictibacillus sp. b24]MDM5314741.1 NADH-quinone oxidoreductase subunit J [Fictibacillus sp. b24]